MRPITRTHEKQQFRTVDEAVEADRRYFDEHPDEDEYIREFVPGEFGKAERRAQRERELAVVQIDLPTKRYLPSTPSALFDFCVGPLINSIFPKGLASAFPAVWIRSVPLESSSHHAKSIFRALASAMFDG
jgi:hypothetical protein